MGRPVGIVCLAHSLGGRGSLSEALWKLALDLSAQTRLAWSELYKVEAGTISISEIMSKPPQDHDGDGDGDEDVDKTHLLYQTLNNTPVCTAIF